MDLQLKDRVVMVVGATGGIGAAVAEAFAAEGASLALVGRDQEKVSALASKLGGGDVSCATFTCDLLDPGQPASVVQQAEARLGRLDVIVNCAGNAKRGSLDEVTDADFESTLQVKLLGPIRLVRAALPGMRERRFGRIVMVGGLNGRNPNGQAVVGGAVNAGAANVARQLAKANAASGITVNVVDPHYTRTRRWERRLDELQERHGISREEASARASSHMPIGRPVEPHEIADVVLFLSSPRTAAINGAIIPVDGGSTEGLY
ncbi:MAG TPA: SDR family oxidoreductase [Chloroflexota bacterium]|nr:SDR family oxidoreductase [Chloroflexota bacterium]